MIMLTGVRRHSSGNDSVHTNRQGKTLSNTFKTYLQGSKMNKSNWKWTHIDIFQDPEGSRLLYTISGDYFSVNPNSGEITLIKVCSGILPLDC